MQSTAERHEEPTARAESSSSAASDCRLWRREFRWDVLLCCLFQDDLVTGKGTSLHRLMRSRLRPFPIIAKVMTLVCQEIWGANYIPCDQVPLTLVKKIDELAKDECENERSYRRYPHATSGDAIVLQCLGRHMKRDPYVWHFDADG